MKTIIHPTYFPNIEFFSHLLKSKNLIFEINDFYQKQTFRNRASIYGSNGKLNLIIPVSFSSSKKEKLKEQKNIFEADLKIYKVVKKNLEDDNTFKIPELFIRKSFN